MKNFKRNLTILSVVIAMVVAILPLAGWTSADIKAEEAPAVQDSILEQVQEDGLQSLEDYGVMPLYGGSKSYTFNFENGKYISFTASAGNWIWPYTDEAVITVKANFNQAYYSFQVRFIWTNDFAKETTWNCPGQLDEISGYPFMLLSSENNYTIKYVKNCDDAPGNPGSRWSCDHIIVRAFAKDGSSGKVQATEIGPVYF